MRPLIGITGPDRRGTSAWLLTSAAIFRAGGRATRLTPWRGAKGPPIDGLVLGGGADLDPSLYAAELGSGGARGVDAERDAYEMKLLADAVARKIPILGICRGAQLINVQFGGSLYGDVAELYIESPHVRSVLPRKRIVIEPRSALAKILDTEACAVNALHHQAIRTLGKGMAVVARDEAGVVQAIERTYGTFCIGVQWHPELMPQHKRQGALFSALVDAARAKSHRADAQVRIIER